MASLNVTLPLPNPLTPLAFIPPKLAYEVTVANYLTVGALAVSIFTAPYIPESDREHRYLYGIF